MDGQEKRRGLESEAQVRVRSPDEATRLWLPETALAPLVRGRMTYEEFLAWADEDTLAGGWMEKWSSTARPPKDTRR